MLFYVLDEILISMGLLFDDFLPALPIDFDSLRSIDYVAHGPGVLELFLFGIVYHFIPVIVMVKPLTFSID
jgi:hypothetical protein